MHFGVATYVNAEARRAVREPSGMAVNALAKLRGMSQPRTSTLEIGNWQASQPTNKALAYQQGVLIVSPLGPTRQ